MSTAEARGGDFRDAAVVASVDALAACPSVDPMNAGSSYCLPAGEDKRFALRGFALSRLRRAALGTCGLLSAAALAWAADGNPWGNRAEDVLNGVSVVVFAGGVLVLLSAVLSKRRFLREHLGDRYDALVAIDSPFKAYAVGIEDRATFSRTKLAPDDLSVVVVDADRQTLVIEGLSHRYLIQAHDILTMRKIAASSWGLEIVYRCGSTPLAIVLTYEHGMRELIRRLGLTELLRQHEQPPKVLIGS